MLRKASFLTSECTCDHRDVVVRAEIVDWMDQRLRAANIERNGAVELRSDQPWARVFSAPTSQGEVWLKVPAGNNFEAGLYEILIQVAPANTLSPIGLDAEHGLLLLPDGGRPLAEVASGQRLVDAMVTALPQYAAVQRAVAERLDEVVALGIVDLRPARLSALFDHATAEVADPAARATLRQMVPTFAAWCEQLTESTIPITIDHNDLHPWNILGFEPVTMPDKDVVFYDWGDSVLAFALGSSLVPISRTRQMTGLPVDNPDVHRMRDAYLEVFTDLATRTELRELIEIAWRVAKGAQAVVWDRSAESIDDYLGDLHRGSVSI